MNNIILKRIISFLYNIFYLLTLRGKVDSKNSMVLFSLINIYKKNKIILTSSKISFSKVNIKGNNNKFSCKGYIANSNINIEGENNSIFFDEGVELKNSRITLIGKNCEIIINKCSTFGSINMVCMGQNNFIEIGENCMFSHNIELWATDSHPIYNKFGTIINKSKPIIIKDNVWIGANTCILKGVTIGQSTIVGMASVVSKSLAGNSIYAGNPARIIRNDVYKWDKNYIIE